MFLLVSGIAIAPRFYLIGTLIAWLASVGVRRGRWAPDMPAVNRVEDHLLIILHDQPRRFLRVASLDLAAQLLLVLELFWLLRGLDVAASPSSIFAIEASTKFFEFAFAVVPLQVGVSEGTYASIFGVVGLPLASGVAIAILRRARSLVIAGLGLMTLTLLTGAPHRTRVGRRSRSRGGHRSPGPL